MTRPPRPVPVAVVRSIAGAGLSVLGVSLGIVVLHWTSGAPLGSLAVVDQVASAPAVPAPSPRVDPSPPAGPSASASGGAGDVLAVSPRTAPMPSPVPSPTAAAPPAVPVTVLNNSRRTRLAARAAARFEAGGWPVALTGNFRGRIPVTTVYYDPGLEGSARAFAARFDGIARVRPRFATLPARGLVVVVTREFAA